MIIEKNKNLRDRNGFKVDVNCKYFVAIQSVSDLQELIKTKEFKDSKHFILGQGYNTVFAGDYEELVIAIDLKGLEKVKETKEYTYIKIGAGEDWPKFVEYCVKQNLAGIENLALIPGAIGSAPVQNIAAYGQEQSAAFYELEAFEIKTGKIKTFSKKECGFRYRNSFFKTKYKGQYIITSITYKLRKVKEYTAETSYHSRYESLKSVLSEFAKEPYTLQDIFKAVIEIRNRKLPKVEEYGTLGSVFLNPFVSVKQLRKIQEKYPNIQYYPITKMQYVNVSDIDLNKVSRVKIAAGWILEELGWKGKTVGNVGTFSKHALIIVTNGKASSNEVISFIESMQKDLQKVIGKNINLEINVVR
jgi:UDP-N-acetylmuramate dehydrogenase